MQDKDSKGYKQAVGGSAFHTNTVTDTAFTLADALVNGQAALLNAHNPNDVVNTKVSANAHDHDLALEFKITLVLFFFHFLAIISYADINTKGNFLKDLSGLEKRCVSHDCAFRSESQRCI